MGQIDLAYALAFILLALVSFGLGYVFRGIKNRRRKQNIENEIQFVSGYNFNAMVNVLTEVKNLKPIFSSLSQQITTANTLYDKVVRDINDIQDDADFWQAEDFDNLIKAIRKLQS